MILLSKGTTNAKTIKNVLPTYILYLSPFKDNSKGISVCPNASPGCISSCLFTAGMGIFSNVQKARRNKTDFYLSDRTNFCFQLWSELEKINSKGIKTAIRLNGTSDLDFHAIVKNRIGKDLFDLRNLVFYDYTKVIGKALKYNGTKYRVTFSRSELNESECIKALTSGINVSIVFNHKKPMPKLKWAIRISVNQSMSPVALSLPGIHYAG